MYHIYLYHFIYPRYMWPFSYSPGGCLESISVFVCQFVRLPKNEFEMEGGRGDCKSDNHTF